MRRHMLRFARPGRGFTLVELLVVIGIIALLISVLLPALSRARDSANTVKCLSNVRQLMLATTLFVQDHKGHCPTSTSDADWGQPSLVRTTDPYMVYFGYRTDAASGHPFVKDWASALMPYLGFRDVDVNNLENANVSTTGAAPNPKVFACPGDPWQDQGRASGYRLYNNVTTAAGNPTGDFPVSYGINADVTCLVDSSATPPVGRWAQSDTVQVYAGTASPTNVPLGCLIGRVYMPSQVLMYADCGTRPDKSNASNPLMAADTLYYTTNGMAAAAKPTFAQAYLKYTLQGLYLQTNGLQLKIPVKRHGGNKVNVAFADGHAASVSTTNFGDVHISPYR